MATSRPKRQKSARRGAEPANAEGGAERIWQVVAMIPHGRVASYGQVSELAGLPRGARLVGRVLSRLPTGSRLPWHRVITASGRIAFPPRTQAHRRQAALLREEGIIVRAGKVSLSRYGWDP